MKKLLTFIASFAITQTSFEAAPRALVPAGCMASCKLADGSLIGPQHNDIERAGVLLVVPVKSPISNHPFDKWGIVVGQDKHFKLWMVGQAGGREVTDTSVPQTAARELLEETGGYMKVSSQTISQLPYIYGEKKQLFVLKTNSTSLAANIKQSVQAAQKNPKLNRHFKEIDDITVVSINNFLRLAQKLDQNKLQPHQFTVKAQDGKVITLQSSYTKIFGHKFNHNQYKYAQLLFQSLCK